ncbi:MAG: hypothetical protein H6735_28080 [Alphaproteobacteria bacterium]|nr:hypothetical protein [Alphaproteobacteria bacterium]
MDTLPALLDGGARGTDVAALLDEMDLAGRRAALQALTGRQQQALYESAADAAPLSLDDFVPGTLAPLTPIAHHGVNTLPLPTSGRLFTKWMTRQTDGTIAGWNGSPWAWLIGPGYFVLRPSEGDEQRYGSAVVDYYQTPRGELPSSWPWVRPNWLGLQALVYGWCHDHMRRVGNHVTIGAAWKWGRPVGSWFVLAREQG